MGWECYHFKISKSPLTSTLANDDQLSRLYIPWSSFTRFVLCLPCWNLSIVANNLSHTSWESRKCHTASTRDFVIFIKCKKNIPFSFWGFCDIPVKTAFITFLWNNFEGEKVNFHIRTHLLAPCTQISNHQTSFEKIDEISRHDLTIKVKREMIIKNGKQ